MDQDDPNNNYTVATAYREVKDTILLPARPGSRGRSRSIVSLAASFDDAGREAEVAAFGKVPNQNASGGWLFHGHIPEHSALGMMSFF